MEIHGFCDDAFTPVRDAFVANFERGNERGAAVCVHQHGRPVVDLWAGVATDDGDPWVRDTIVNVYSITKTMTFICILMLADSGEIDLTAPVARHWPEFATAGKADITIEQVMAHTAGLSGFDPAITPEDLGDWDRVCAGLAAQAPWWTPGDGSGYHLITQGFLLGEIVRRVTGRSIGTFFADEIAGPLDADFHIGLPASEDARVADLVPPERPDIGGRPDGGTAGSGAGHGRNGNDTGPTGEPGARHGSPGRDEADPGGTATPDEPGIGLRSMRSCPLRGTEPATRAWRAAEIPAAGGIGNARSVARIHAALACGGELDGTRLLSTATVESILDEQSFTRDRVLGVPMRYGRGFGLMSDTVPLSPNDRAFFWGGWGGSIAVIDLDTRLSVAYVMNRMSSGMAGDLRGGTVAVSATHAAARL